MFDDTNKGVAVFLCLLWSADCRQVLELGGQKAAPLTIVQNAKMATDVTSGRSQYRQSMTTASLQVLLIAFQIRDTDYA